MKSFANSLGQTNLFEPVNLDRTVLILYFKVNKVKVKIKLIFLNVKTKIVPKCITIQRNQKYLRQASQHSTGFPVGYRLGLSR